MKKIELIFVVLILNYQAACATKGACQQDKEDVVTKTNNEEGISWLKMFRIAVLGLTREEKEYIRETTKRFQKELEESEGIPETNKK